MEDSIISNPYFIFAQILVIIPYILFKNNNWKSDRFNLFTNKIQYSITTILAIYVGIKYNQDYQIFCNPVNWTLYILVPIGIWLVVFPFLSLSKYFTFINSVFSGISIFILVYILTFGSWNYLIFLFFCSFVFLPLYFISRKLRQYTNANYFDFFSFYGLCFSLPWILLYLLISRSSPLIQVSNKRTQKFTIIILILMSLFSAIYMKFISLKLNDYNENVELVSNYKKNVISNYYLELVLGAHWKYHTKICLYDGWRPPFHDPFVRTTKLIFHPFGEFHGEMSLTRRKEIYSKVFPNNSMKLNCKCAKKERWP